MTSYTVAALATWQVKTKSKERRREGWEEAKKVNKKGTKDGRKPKKEGRK